MHKPKTESYHDASFIVTGGTVSCLDKPGATSQGTVGTMTTLSSSDTSSTWWRNQVETFSTLLAICTGNSPVACEFPAQRPATRSFGVFFDLYPNKRLSKQWWGWWFETPSCPLWHHRNVYLCYRSMSLRWCYSETHRKASIMTVADVLGPNRHQAINNHRAVPSAIKNTMTVHITHTYISRYNL